MSNKEHKGTILIVDDTPTNLDLLFKYLTRSGFEVLLAQSGKEAIMLAQSAAPDIVLLDVMMPEMDGFETCRWLKVQDSTKDIPIIFMTALVDVDNKVQAFEMGAVDYVTKPFERKEVLARINTHLTLRQLQRDLQQEIGIREKAEQQLREYAAELQNKNEELDAFAHTVAHNLKNSLNALTGIAYLLALDHESMPPDELKKYLNIIARSGRKSTNIVQELLTLASVRQQEIDTSALTDMGLIVSEAQQRISNMIEETGAHIMLPESWPVAQGYAPWVEEIWVNYLSNAVKYGGKPPVITIGASRLNHNQIKFWVKDNGSGLTPQEQPLLFTPYTQLSKLNIQGHGLGLSIVRRIVERLGGQVGVESEGTSGQGSTFSFTLPAADTN